ncbi:SDR family oxidoreductase [Chitinophaga arvensicola]|uniref:NADP-dependent 3-hydroxy acid dehydrogenase YdfG n=1 Tax=Chitinophaga arvensicola TaxID=29529 RepID=A0A1I0S4S4_9BACT|nr:SDR family oxidoreductase [Chitinophaga arvensicola]SEW49626.1 NADP-dependent 3-hydroxy acid dehydrogenase YdfG [Chitinophaga arvensicola]
MSKTILITGSSSGIGKATAIFFAEQGWHVIATMRTPENETELNTFKNVWVTKLDVSDPAGIQHTVEESIHRFGKIDVLVNNAGYGAYGPLEVFDRESILRQFNTNVIGLLDVSRAVIPHFRANKGGVIINVSSMGGRFAFPFGTLYHGTKFAVEGISESLNFELATFGGKVKIIEPGATATDFAGRSFDFKNDTTIAAYQGLMTTLTKMMDNLGSMSVPARVVAEKIYEAATDDTDQLRYPATPDAQALLGKRSKEDDNTFINGLKKQFGL